MSSWHGTLQARSIYSKEQSPRTAHHGQTALPCRKFHSLHHNWCYHSGLQAPHSPAILKCMEKHSGFRKLSAGYSAKAGGSLKSNQYHIPIPLTLSTTLCEDNWGPASHRFPLVVGAPSSVQQPFNHSPAQIIHLQVHTLTENLFPSSKGTQEWGVRAIFYSLVYPVSSTVGPLRA